MLSCGIDVELVQGLGLQCAGVSVAALVARVGALAERVDRNRRHRREGQRARPSPPRTDAAAGARSAALAVPFSLAPPGENGVAEDVVEDLVAGLRPPPAPSTGRTIRSRPSVASTGTTRRSSTDAYSARSPAPWAIFVPEGVTRYRKTSAATSCSVWRQLLDGAVEMRCGRSTLRRRAARASRARNTFEPCSRSSSQTRSSTSWRYGASMRPSSALPGGEATARLAEVDLSRRGLVEHGFDQLAARPRPIRRSTSL